MISPVVPPRDPENELLKLADSIPQQELERMLEFIAALMIEDHRLDLQTLKGAGEAILGLKDNHKLTSRLRGEATTYLEALQTVQIPGPLGELSKLTDRSEPAARDLHLLLSKALGKNLQEIGNLARQMKTKGPGAGWQL